MANDKHDDDDRRKREEDEKRARERQRTQQQAPADKAAAEQQAAQTREAAGAASIGAQVILDYNSDASLGARGGIGTMAENVAARDAYLVSVGLDPVAPSGPPLGSAEALMAQREAMQPQPQFLPPASSKATRMSSLAAGIEESDLPPPEPPVTTRGGAA